MYRDPKALAELSLPSALYCRTIGCPVNDSSADSKKSHGIQMKDPTCSSQQTVTIDFDPNLDRSEASRRSKKSYHRYGSHEACAVCRRIAFDVHHSCMAQSLLLALFRQR